MLIPDEAILSDQDRKYVYVVNGENKVEYRARSDDRAAGDPRAGG